MKVGVVLNPIAGGGRLKHHWPEAAASLNRHFGEFDLRETQTSGDAERLAIDLAANGCELVIAAGGDGTASEVADGLLQVKQESGRTSALALLPCGTGIDFARGLGLPRGIDATLKHIAEADTRKVDAGRVCYIDDHGALASRHFINIASLGLSGATDRAVNADKRKGRVSAKALFFWRTVLEFMRYRFQNVRITIDDGDAVEARMALVAVANGKFFGGGMMIAPDADLSDGEFDIVIVRAANKLGLIRDIRLLYGGRHRNHPAIAILRGRKVLVEPVGDAEKNGALVDIDGESPGRIPATFEILPGALTLRC
ncbi:MULTISPECIES: diacylglycerol kinase family protein [unclassified Mesorhizobium]|uniref:diacylglycerol/lipid kinase family protein n=1 Tax=unclassified Mesorhizobium TaxID=325217 RepID=UPI000BAFF20C|nr:MULTISPECIES: diacylglycerol kinase family protein [unclassified Mesorhizobium]TGT57398.1 diacylglycerol kinase family lipid kinase [Mesorhizobium sp. M00.F.Ca.ET.170.01.1.1]AZO11871.1 diacylglycerol kinase family lipid kinase [Mesorhizobium sp. M3A.F.Ca.ET.080.04.2.1]PBB86234.1 diacylglycerol kinase [Mesorhizobium sp. WSM3876]RWB73152.1 MAG: diacylglycerol kinase family lipid kinase [Mesorhizobium sp.]RWB82709.1 MAG: diacylglycerol kinase family lipid kinase [Mesorhizobium sp.]